MGQCQAIVAEAVEAFDQIDILFCGTSEGKHPYFPSHTPIKPILTITAVIGTVEELAASQRTLTLVRDQFETNFFGNVNIIKAVLPAMREKKTGHLMVLTGISE